jgi:hypothetical protein
VESRREETFMDDISRKSHIEKELLSHLDGIKTVFDGAVTHFAISQPMIDKAKELLGLVARGNQREVRTTENQHSKKPGIVLQY